jgi:hypothetical protein
MAEFQGLLLGLQQDSLVSNLVTTPLMAAEQENQI